MNTIDNRSGHDQANGEPEASHVSNEYCYVTEEERQEYRGRLEEAYAKGMDSIIGCQAAHALRQLALDRLVMHAHHRAYWDQIEIGAPLERKGSGWLSHQEKALKEAASSAFAFRRGLREIVRKENKAVLKASLTTTMEWWVEARQTGAPASLESLIDYSANQLAVVLMCKDFKGTSVRSNLSAWTVLAHRVATRLIEPHLRPFFPHGIVPDASGETNPSKISQGRVIFYIQYILDEFQNSTTKFEYKSPGQTIKYLRGMCLNCERDIQREQKKEEQRQREEEKSLMELPQVAPLPHATTLSLIAQYVESDLKLSIDQKLQDAETDQKPQDAGDAKARLQERRTFYKINLWNVLNDALGYQSAIQYWLLMLLFRDGFTWDVIVELLEDKKDCRIRYEDSLPPGVTWEEMNPDSWKIKKNARNLCKFFSSARSVIETELVKNKAAFPSTAGS